MAFLATYLAVFGPFLSKKRWRGWNGKTATPYLGGGTLSPSFKTSPETVGPPEGVEKHNQKLGVTPTHGEGSTQNGVCVWNVTNEGYSVKTPHADPIEYRAKMSNMSGENPSVSWSTRIQWQKKLDLQPSCIVTALTSFLHFLTTLTSFLYYHCTYTLLALPLHFHPSCIVIALTPFLHCHFTYTLFAIQLHLHLVCIAIRLTPSCIHLTTHWHLCM